MKRILTLLLVAFCFSAVAQCEADHVVEASSFMYAPNTLTIGQGESVAWINLGGTHDVNGDSDSQTGMPFGNPEWFYIGAVTGAPWGECIGTHTFNIPGTYNYDCSIGNHAALGMVGTIFVNAGTPGCTHLEACNYSSEATFNDGSCTYAEEFYDCEGNCLYDFDGDGVCWELEVEGCPYAAACNYHPAATEDDGSCIYPVPGFNCDGTCIDTDMDGVCEFDEILGCPYAAACNYHPEATEDDGTCEYTSCVGCTVPAACNFDAGATIDNGSCLMLDECGVCGGSGIPEGGCDCDGNVPGCTNPAAQNYDAYACADDGSCLIGGCTDTMACNYDASATADDMSCEYAAEYYDCDGNCLNDTDSDGVCDVLEVAGCTDDMACNYNDDATDDDGMCVYSGDACQDDNEATINEAYNDDCECVGVDFLETCDYIGHPEWLNMELGVYSSEFSFIDSSFSLIDSSLSGIWLFGPGYNLIVGEAFGTELVLNMPLVFTDEVTGGSFQVLSWSNLVADNVPPGVDLSVPETLEGGSQACLEMSGVDYPTEEGLFEVSIVGEVVMNFFGTPISIGDVSTSFLIQVSSNPNGVPGCMYETASNYMPWATFDVGICEFEGCTDPAAFNFSPAHTLEDGSCLYTDPSGCNENEVDYQLCLEGTVWSEELGGCVVANVSDTDFDGCVGINDFLVHLSNFGSGCGPEPAWACGDPLEYQGYEYQTVQIGDQCWFAENLRADTYLNGDAIAQFDGQGWASANEGGVSVYGEDGMSSCVDYSPIVESCDPSQALVAFGRIYNWYAISDERGLCPSNWHVPSDEDFMELEVHIGIDPNDVGANGWRGNNEGNYLKTQTGWHNGGNGSNDFGFDLVPAGARGTSGQYDNAGRNGYLWTSTSDGSSAYYRRIEAGNASIARGSYVFIEGYPARCIKDTE